MADPLVKVFSEAVWRAQEQPGRPIDFHAFYPARVVSVDADGVGVVFDNERLGTKTGVPLSCAFGQTRTITPGTRVLMGWMEGRPDQPFVAAIWLGGGSLVRVQETFTDEYRFTGPEVIAEEDLHASHDIAIGPAPTVLLVNLDWVVTLTGGGDRLMEIRGVFSSQVPANSDFCEVVYGRGYGSRNPCILVGNDKGLGVGYVKTPSGFRLRSGSSNISTGTYLFTVKVGG